MPVREDANAGHSLALKIVEVRVEDGRRGQVVGNAPDAVKIRDENEKPGLPIQGESIALYAKDLRVGAGADCGSLLRSQHGSSSTQAWRRQSSSRAGLVPASRTRLQASEGAPGRHPRGTGRRTG